VLKAAVNCSELRWVHSRAAVVSRAAVNCSELGWVLKAGWGAQSCDELLKSWSAQSCSGAQGCGGA
jgi:hypothetical protein